MRPAPEWTGWRKLGKKAVTIPADRTSYHREKDAQGRWVKSCINGWLEILHSTHLKVRIADGNPAGCPAGLTLRTLNH